MPLKKKPRNEHADHRSEKNKAPSSFNWNTFNIFHENTCTRFVETRIYISSLVS